MAEQGSLVIRTYASDKLIPVQGTRVTITKSTENGDELIAYGITDENGKTQLFYIETPDASLSLDENNTVKPFTEVNIKVEKEGYNPPGTGQSMAPVLGAIGMGLSASGIGICSGAWRKRRKT